MQYNKNYLNGTQEKTLFIANGQSRGKHAKKDRAGRLVVNSDIGWKIFSCPLRLIPAVTIVILCLYALVVVGVRRR
jgi:hypothetical protein